MISACVAVYRSHGAPNIATLAESIPTALGNRPGELIVALNGIDARAAGLPSGARTVSLPVNTGVAPGWNSAGRAATGDYLCFVNDDAVLGERSLQFLADALEADLATGVASPGGSYWDIDAGRHRSFVDAGSLDPGETVECDSAVGYLFMTRRETWERLDGFDEAYAPASFEEVDYCVAAKRTLGLKTVTVGGIGVDHDFQISARRHHLRTIQWSGKSERLFRIHRRNRAHFRAKWSR
ncbi:MAG: glycosyltransferase family 2 protein [Solirubrobacterales bacterium]